MGTRADVSGYGVERRRARGGGWVGMVTAVLPAARVACVQRLACVAVSGRVGSVLGVGAAAPSTALNQDSSCAGRAQVLVIQNLALCVPCRAHLCIAHVRVCLAGIVSLDLILVLWAGTKAAGVAKKGDAATVRARAPLEEA